MSLSMMPPCMVWPCARVCGVAMFAPSTITRSASGRTRVISPSLPRSLPEITRTRSPLRSFMSQHLRGERHDPHEAAVAQLASDRTEDPGAAGLHLVVDEHR